jgi:hypothetical protein
MKNKIFGSSIVALGFFACIASPLMAQSAKTAVDTTSNTLTIQSLVASPIEGLASQIHIAQQKDIHVDISLECGLATDTTVKSKGKHSEDKSTPDGSTATASVQVQVKVYDESGTTELTQFKVNPAGPITFCKRTQTLEAKLQGFIDNSACFDSETGDFSPDAEGCNLETEEIRLLLDTMNANAFNWVIENLDSGVYTIKAMVMINDCGSDPALCSFTGENGSVGHSMASVGNGVMILDEIRLSNN